MASPLVIPTPVTRIDFGMNPGVDLAARRSLVTFDGNIQSISRLSWTMVVVRGRSTRLRSSRAAF